LLFSSERFLYFFVVVFAVYWLLPGQRPRLLWLLGASLFFYATWNRWLAGLIAASTTVDYWVARGIAASRSPRRRSALVAMSVCMNLGLLAYFKYANFFLRSLEEALNAAGATASFPVLRVILPIGISFYTFEAISYVVDVHRGRVAAERSLVRFMLFITFFPHLVAGPIVRPAFFLPQLRRPKHWDWMRLHLGLQFFLLGLFKKIAIADRMAMFADPVFAHPAKYGSAAAWAAVVAYTLQIYCDFSGYSDMAVGLAHSLGYKLPRNFNLPYLSQNISEFWRRWHISLSTWLRDYLFIPLGGSRTEKHWQTTRNLLVTMTLGGLWHGAAVTFVIWGFAHGCLLVAHRRWQEWRPRLPGLDAALATPLGRFSTIAVTLACVSLGWVIFRSTSLTAASQMIEGLFSVRSGSLPPLPRRSLLVLSAIVIAAHLAGRYQLWKRLEPRLPAPMLAVAYAAFAALTLLLAPDSTKTFIYFQF
jgi:alginate O-acetyltransferase complex protein AlgI